MKNSRAFTKVLQRINMNVISSMWYFFWNQLQVTQRMKQRKEKYCREYDLTYCFEFEDWCVLSQIIQRCILRTLVPWLPDITMPLSLGFAKSKINKTQLCFLESVFQAPKFPIICRCWISALGFNNIQPFSFFWYDSCHDLTPLPSPLLGAWLWIFNPSSLWLFAQIHEELLIPTCIQWTFCYYPLQKL